MNSETPRGRRAMLVEIAYNRPTPQAIEWYLRTFFGALEQEWVLDLLDEAGRAHRAKDHLRAEWLFAHIIDTQQQRAGTAPQTVKEAP